jgi:putative ABC transport system permease protein
LGVVKKAPLLSSVNSDVWLPISTSMNPEEHMKDFEGVFHVMLLADNKGNPEKLKSELKRVERRIINPSPDVDSVKFEAKTALEGFAMTGSDNKPDYAGTVIKALFIIILFLLIPTISLMNLSLTRIAERSSEIGVRKSFGASAQHLVGQFITESIIITLIGGFIGALLSIFAMDLLIRILNAFDPLYEISSGQFVFNWYVFVFCIAICLLFGLLSGVYPAFRMSRLHPVQALKGPSI